MQCVCSEIYEADRWHTDSTYHTPMASCDCGSVFIGDVVTCDGVDDYAVIYAKVARFIKVVGMNYFIQLITQSMVLSLPAERKTRIKS